MAPGAPSLRRVRQDGGRPSHRYSKSEGGISYPPSAHPEFLRILGHHRKSPNGSRDRSIGGMGLPNAPVNSRVSPYPSSRAAPFLGFDPLPVIPDVQILPPPTGMGRGRPTSMPAYGPSSYGIPPGGIGELGQQISAGTNLGGMGSALNDGIDERTLQPESLSLDSRDTAIISISENGRNPRLHRSRMER